MRYLPTIENFCGIPNASSYIRCNQMGISLRLDLGETLGVLEVIDARKPFPAALQCFYRAFMKAKLQDTTVSICSLFIFLLRIRAKEVYYVTHPDGDIEVNLTTSLDTEAPHSTR